MNSKMNYNTMKQIAQQLASLPGTGFAVDCIRQSAYSNTAAVIEMIKSQAENNRKIMAGIIGEALLTQIEAL